MIIQKLNSMFSRNWKTVFVIPEKRSRYEPHVVTTLGYNERIQLQDRMLEIKL